MWDQGGRGRGLRSSPCTITCQGASAASASTPGPPLLTHLDCLSQDQLVEAEPEPWLPPGGPKERRDGKKSAKLPETPKTAEEMWQHSVIGDYLAKYRVRTRLPPLCC